MTYQEENKILANDLLDRDYYRMFRSGEGILELFLIGTCKQKCDYCYLQKNHKELYPKDIECHKDDILKNLERSVKWYIKKGFKSQIDIFSGEWITTDLFEPVFDIFYNCFKQYTFSHRINLSIPDNMAFISDDALTERVQYHIDRLKTVGVDVYISASIDGKYCDNNRKLHTDEYYDKLFKFMEHNHYLAHPMVSSTNINNWIENYEWFKQTAPKYIFEQLSMGVVRDDTWREESISKLVEFYDYIIDDKFNNLFNKNKLSFLKWVLQSGDRTLGTNEMLNCPIALEANNFINMEDNFPCSIQHMLCLRMADLSVGMCHRLFYPELVLGKYNIENDEIGDFEPYLTELLIAKDHVKCSTSPFCESCIFTPICSHFCLGNSYEVCGSPFIPARHNCRMQKMRLLSIVLKLASLGVFDEIDNLSNDFVKLYLKKLITNIVDAEETIKNDR